MEKNTGFTLIEMLVVVLILGILTSIALPQYQRAVKRAQGTEARVTGKAIADAQNIYYMENKKYDAQFVSNGGSKLAIRYPEMRDFTVVGSSFTPSTSTDTTFYIRSTEDPTVQLVYYLKRGRLLDTYCMGSACMDYFACHFIGSGGTRKCELD